MRNLQGQGVAVARPGEQLNHVVVERRRAHRVFIAGETVDDLGEVELHVQRALGRRHQAEVQGGHRHPLAHLAIAGAIFLQVAQVIVA